VGRGCRGDPTPPPRARPACRCSAATARVTDGRPQPFGSPLWQLCPLPCERAADPVYWCLHVLRSSHVRIERVTIRGDWDIPNNDGGQGGGEGGVGTGLGWGCTMHKAVPPAGSSSGLHVPTHRLLAIGPCGTPPLTAPKAATPCTAIPGVHPPPPPTPPHPPVYRRYRRGRQPPRQHRRR
jgi:hypothetical protein